MILQTHHMGLFYTLKPKGDKNMFDTAQPQAAGTANQPEEIAAVPESGESGSPENGSFLENDTANEEPFMTVRYNKEDKPLTKEEAIVYAQKGMNYDKLQERLKETAAKLSEYEKTGYRQSGGDTEEAKQPLIDAQLDSFMRGNPGVDPRKLPESVLSAWKRGIPLNEAYLAHQAQELAFKIRQMEREAAQAEANRKNGAASMGSVASSGSTRGKALSEDSIRNMTPAELEKNHERIWAYLTGK